MRIAGQKRGETYPQAVAAAAAAGGLLVKIGFDNSVSAVGYNNDGIESPVLRAVAGEAVHVTLTGFTPGNLIVTAFSIGAVDDQASGPAGTIYQAQIQIDLGAGFRVVQDQEGYSITSGTTDHTSMSMFSRLDAVVPETDEITTADPIVRIGIRVDASREVVRVPPQSAVLCVMELNAAAAQILQLPTTILAPP